VTRRFNKYSLGRDPEVGVDTLPPWYPDECQAYDLSLQRHLNELPETILKDPAFRQYYGSPNTLLLGQPDSAGRAMAYIVPTVLFNAEYMWVQ
jgi:hypothetical protein